MTDDAYLRKKYNQLMKTLGFNASSFSPATKDEVKFSFNKTYEEGYHDGVESEQLEQAERDKCANCGVDHGKVYECDPEDREAFLKQKTKKKRKV